eukprot:Rmarinus@m.11564
MAAPRESSWNSPMGPRKVRFDDHGSNRTPKRRNFSAVNEEDMENRLVPVVLDHQDTLYDFNASRLHQLAPPAASDFPSDFIRPKSSSSSPFAKRGEKRGSHRLSKSSDDGISAAKRRKESQMTQRSAQNDEAPEVHVDPRAGAMQVVKDVMLDPTPRRDDVDIQALRGERAISDDFDPSQLQSGEDAINFFARNRQNTGPIKFVHLNRPRTGDNFRPYDLVVVPREEVEPDHFTMSASGLVNVKPGQPTEFIPLAEWMRQSSMFNNLTSIRFFKHYIVAKAFRTWRSNVRFKLYCQQRAKLVRKLFLAKNSFCGTLLEINALCTEMRDIRLMQIATKHTYATEEFMSLQTGERAQAAKGFESIIDQLQAKLEKVCEDVNARARLSDDALLGGGVDAIGDVTVGMSKDKSKSMVAVKQEQLARLRAVRQAQAEARQLGDFIRLADYMAVESLVTLTINTNKEFLEILQAERKNGLFFTTIGYIPSGISFSPAQDAIISMVSSMSEGMINTVNVVPRLLYMRVFKPYFSGQSITGPTTASTIRTSNVFQGIRTDTDAVILRSFSESAEYAQYFNRFREIYEFGQSWNEVEFEQANHSVREFKQHMTRMRKWGTEIDRMKVSNVVGILHVDSKKLRSSLLPITVEALNVMKQCLLKRAREQCVEVLNIYNSRIRKLSERPKNLDQFAEYCAYKQGLTDESRTLHSTLTQVDEMYDLLQAYDVKVPSADQVKVDDLHSIQETFQASLQAAVNQIDTQMASMTITLDKNIDNVNEDLLSTLASLHTGDYFDPDADPKVVLSKLEGVRDQVEQMEEKAEQYTRYQKLFGLTPSEYANLTDAKNAYDQRRQVWESIDRWKTLTHEWMTSEFTKIPMEDVEKEVLQTYKLAHKMVKKREDDAVAKLLKQSAEEWKQRMPVLLDLGNPNMQARHWEKIFQRISLPYTAGMPFTMDMLVRNNIFEHKDFIGEVSGNSSGEAALEVQLEKVRSGWENMEFTVKNYREQRDVFILGSVDEIMTLLEDHQVTLQTCMASRFVAGIKSQIEAIEAKLRLLADVLDEWLQCQKQWMYLECIFGQGDIQKQLPAETAKFLKVDKTWRDIMRKCHKNPAVMQFISTPSLLEHLQESNRILEEVQKSLEEYLETKRTAFPRFYFLSNDELLEILSQTRDPTAVQAHMIKCFDGIKRLDFQDEGPGQSPSIRGMVSSEGEKVEFADPPIAKGAVEFWLLQVEKAMRRSLYLRTKACLEAYDDDKRGEWFFAWPAQSVIAVEQIQWSDRVTEALNKISSGENPNALKEYLDFFISQLDHMAIMVRGDLGKLERTLMGALAVIDVHGREVVRQIIESKASSVFAFDWQKQLRYYWDADIDEGQGDCVIRQTNAYFRYGYEYLGNTPRLVITPLTDKCYMTLTGALHVRLGGAPAGPAGTGKTETTKDLGKALAFQVVVFNCSDGLDYKMMGQFFSGLSQAGAWACFDEFNRIDIEVLSVIAQQCLTIQRALVLGQSRFVFEGREIPLDQKYGCFITMNPGYAGRTELPDNLKALFRPVAMMVPDYALIAEIILFSEGFQDAKTLSRKMAQLYRLSSEQLSQQSHYDFGMRAVKSVLVMAGSLKRSNPDLSEDVTLIRALRDSNVPKFLADDLPLFYAIIRDLFPRVEIPDIDYGVLQIAIENQLTAAKLQTAPMFVSKVIQLYETMLVRHGVMLVGATLTGKSTVHATLAKALTQLAEEKVENLQAPYEEVQRRILNPKSITMGELYGEFNEVSHEWTDGLVSSLVRQFVADESPKKKWLVFDGPVDALWIESMNTVLDDNKTLCLVNGERIKLPSTVTMMFEVQDLLVASPATVSRCGMVYLEPVHLGWRPLAQTWMALSPERTGLPPNIFKRVFELMEKTVDSTLAMLRSDCREHIESVDFGLVRGLLNLFECLITDENHKVDETTPNLDQLVVQYYCFAFVWSMGANLDDRSRSKFDLHAKQVIGRLCSEFPLDAERAVYDYAVDPTFRKFVPWTELVPNFRYDPAVPYFNILVPTTDTTRLRFLMDTMLKKGYSMLVGGNTGVGKTVIINEFLRELPDDKFVFTTGTLSAQTTSNNLEGMLLAKLDKKRKNLLGPPAGKKMLFYVDDLNMPQVEVYGAQPPLELLRQVLDHGGFYDRYKLFFKKIMDVITIASCGPPGGGRNTMTPRLIRHFHLVNVSDLSADSMTRIFEGILSGFLGDFPPTCSALSKPLVLSTVEVYNAVATGLLPTPAKCHYTFNLRDMSKVIQGMLQARPENVADSDQLIRLWCHEEIRVFADRLVDSKDRTWFYALLQEKLKKNLLVDWKTEQFANVLWGDYLSPEDNEEKFYAEVVDMDKLRERLADAQEEYVIEMNKPMGLVFFQDAISHISRICRILRQPRGNALLVGVGGSGRQSLTRLATHMAEMKLKQIEITRGYGLNEFREDLKDILVTAGTKSKGYVFLLSDTQIISETFLEDVNNILNSGTVPTLFGNDDIERIIQATRPLAKAAGKIDARDVIYDHFVHLVRENLHVVLAMSPVGDAFRNRLRMFPSLVNCCTIDWFDRWPEDALYAVATSSFREVDLGGDDTKDAISRICVHIHVSILKASEKFLAELRRHNYTTPTSYLELITIYLSMLEDQREAMKTKINRLKGGLNKLEECNIMVGKLQVDLTKLQPVLQESAQATAKLMVEVSEDQKAAAVVRETVSKEEAEVAEATKKANAIRDDAQKDLDAAMPAFYAAIDALKSLNKNDITEIKSFAKPPPLVQTVMEGVCLLKGVKQTWDEAKKLLNQADFIQQLEKYDKDNIPDRMLKQLQKYVNNPQFQPEVVEKVSRAAKSLCLWVRAMDSYARVAKTVEPKRQALKEAESEVASMQQMLAEKQASLAEVEARVAQLEAKFEAAKAKSASLEEESKQTKLRLERAETLVNGLSGEQKRWREGVEALEGQRENLVGSVLLSAACVAYLGPFTFGYRQDLMGNWVARCMDLGVPVSQDFSLPNTLGDPVQIREWSIHHLPHDQLSIENAIISTQARRWPLFIDPQGQANRWVKSMERDNNMQVIKLTEANFLRTIENCVRVGTPVLCENVEESMDPSLEPILLKQTFKVQGRVLIRLGDTDVDYSPDFKFYMTTKLPNPHYPPEVCVKVTLVNFTVTPQGLEDQLLASVVRYERPDLEEQKDKLVVQIADGERQLKLIEDRILQLLASSSGNILDDSELINTLAASRMTSTEINHQVEVAQETTAQIDTARERYRPVATRGSILYFVVSDMSGVDPMYQYSLPYFNRLFERVLEQTPKSETLEERLTNVIKAQTEFIYANICRGLFEKDKMLFSSLIAVQIERQSGTVTDSEWNFFLRGGGLVEAVNFPENPSPDWLQQRVWLDLCVLSDLPMFSDIHHHVMRENDTWKAWATAKEPHAERLPDEWDKRLTHFQKLLLLRLFRIEKVVFGIPDYVVAQLGRRFVEFPPFDIASAFDYSGPLTPMIFVLSSGSDPMSYLLSFAKAQGYADKLKSISLGQGQGPIAEGLIEEAKNTGGWVCLQNCHLSASWMPALEKILEELETQDVHDDFRLWLTSMPSKHFPVVVLQSGIKMTNEPPKGLRANILRTFLDMPKDDFETAKKPKIWKRLLFALAFFHAVILERRKYGAVGWNIPYEWMTSDLDVSITNLKMYLEEHEEVPYQTLNYVLGVVNYGGRITDMWDQRCATCILRNYIRPEILSESFAFTEDGSYRPPPECSLEDVRDYVRSLPIHDNPLVFELNENANITFQTKESRTMLNTIIDIQPRMAGAGGGKSPDELAAEIAADTQAKLPELLTKDLAHDKTFAVLEDGSMNPLGVCLNQEMLRFNKLINVMRSSLIELQRAIKGLVVMSQSLDEVYSSFLNQRVPQMWANAAYPSLKPLASWVQDLVDRVEFIRSWIVDGPPPTFWVPAFFFPQGFLTSALQMHARRTLIAIDSLTFRTEVTRLDKEDVVETPDTGIYVHGFFMEGARWNRETMSVDEALPGELYCAMPVIWMDPQALGTPLPTNNYECPLYKTSTRAGTLSTTGHSTNFVMAINITSFESEDKWVRRGAAMLCQLNE